MFCRTFKLFAAALISLLLVACGSGESAPAPSGLAVRAAESSVTVSWDTADGVEYWLFYAPTAYAPTRVDSMEGWFGLPGGNVLLKVSSPYVIGSLANGVSYSFTVNGRKDNGAGGPGVTPVLATPRMAGASWTAGAAIAGGATDLRGVAFGSVYVAAGTGGALYTSTDGATWSATNYTGSAALNGAVYAVSYKVVGDAGVILTSPDAVTWTVQKSGTSQNLYAVTSNLFSLNVAVGAGGTIVTSADAITWTAATNSGTSSDLYAVSYSTYNGGTWLAAGAGGVMVQSSDGLNWHTVTSNSQTDLHGIAYGANKFVAVGAFGTALVSSDGTNWVAQTLPGELSLNAVSYGAQFVAVGAAGSSFTSADGITWTQVASPTSQDLFAVARATLAYSAVGAAGTNLLAK